MSKLESNIRETANEFPERLAVQFRDRCISYDKLLKILDALSDRVKIVKGMRLMILLPDCLPSYLFHLRIFLSGGIVVPVSVQSSTAKIEQLCARVKPHLLITNQVLRQRHRTGIGSLPCLVIKSDEPNIPWGFQYELMGGDTAVDPVNGNIQSGDLRMIVFTSGSTGEPKGVCLSEANILSAAGMNVEFLSLGPLRKSLITVPLYDYYGFIQIYSHILGRCGFIFGENIILPDQLFRRIREEDVTDLVLVPHTLREMLRMLRSDYNGVMQKLQIITTSSDVLTSDLLNMVFALNPNLRIFNIYGLTEAGRACFRKIDSSFVPSNSIGKPSRGVEIVIDGSPGEPGEIIIKGPNVMLGYMEGISEDRVNFRPCTEMRTGDLGYLNSRDEIILIGRKDHMINIRGTKMHPSEIETIALRAPGVVDALAYASKSNEGAILIHLSIVVGNEAFNLEEIRGHMRRNLHPLFIPREISIVPSINRTEIGSKILRPRDLS
jgi:acyl-CoA synthetase (AMP-forming)/AMP-acid ligase II